MEEYIAAVAETLSTLLGERGLGQKIADDVADFCKLDLLRELAAAASATNAAAATTTTTTSINNETAVVQVLDILRRNVWHDERIYQRGMEELFHTVLRRRDLFFARNLVENAHGLPVLLHGMRRCPRNGAIQKHGASILWHVLDDSLSPYGVNIDDEEAVQVAGVLVAALRNHENRNSSNNNPRVAAHVKQAAIAAMSVRTPSGDTNRELIQAIAPAGGIPLLFSALSDAVNGRFPVFGGHFDQALFIGNCLFLLYSILTTSSDPTSRRMFFHYARDNPDWRHPVEHMQNDEDLMLRLPGAEPCLAVIRETLSDF